MSDYDDGDSSLPDQYEEGDEEFFFDEEDEPANSSAQSKEKRFTPLSAEEIETEQKKAIQQVRDLTELPAHVARHLLEEMRWSYESLAELYFENPDKLLSKAGVAVKGKAVHAAAHDAASSNASDSSEEVTCQVCWESFPRGEVQAKMTCIDACGHSFCNDCWRRHLRVQIDDEGQAARIPCAGETIMDGKMCRCNIVVDEHVVESLLAQGDDKALLQKYRGRMIESYVNNNPCVKWCPARDCTNAVRITADFDPSGFRTAVQCSEDPLKGHVWCFSCKEEPHVPASCDDIMKWKKKCQEDSETCNWLQANTKDCPRCRVAINKDGGCNHMHCKRCDNHFCWVCLGPFEHTTYQHTCNKFVPVDPQVNSCRAALERYIHHFERFQNHVKSREFESRLRESALAKMQKMQEEGNKTYMDVQFMKQATSQLIESRQILQWTYVVGYYEPAWLIRNIFEMNQAELENATEKLSNMLEAEEITWCEEQERVKMINQTNQVKTRLDHLFQQLEEWKNVFMRKQDMLESPVGEDSPKTAPESGDTTPQPRRAKRRNRN